jgi:hypothetical protein
VAHIQINIWGSSVLASVCSTGVANARMRNREEMLV